VVNLQASPSGQALMNLNSDPTTLESIDWAAIEKESAHLLSRYIQFDTTNPPGNEAMAIEFLAELLHERGFKPQIIQSAPGRANLIVRLKSQTHATAPPCLLYAHADVVPAEPADWMMAPFDGVIQDGFVWGRGALDNKGLGIIFLQALTLLKQFAPPLQRDIILLVAADEETSGKYGVAWLLDHHPDLIKAEYVWDEGGMGLQQPNRYAYCIAIAEKISLTVKLVAHGAPGHAAVPRLDNPQDRLVQALSRIKRWKRPQRLVPAIIEMLKTLAADQPFPRSVLFANAGNAFLWPLLHGQLTKDPFLSSLICDTINLTVLRGGQSSNVIPAQAEAKLDVRLLPDEDPTMFLNNLRSMIADPKVSVEIESVPPAQMSTASQTAFYQALAETLKTIDPAGRVTPYLTPGATDSRFFRAAGMKAYGFMPMQLSDKELSRIHGIDERVSTTNLRWGIQVVFETLRRL
jgi:acetylornithine deacetylase/succinyl-diaminopimelate desuccinylase-like protein